jgi:hypothetical protein
MIADEIKIDFYSYCNRYEVKNNYIIMESDIPDDYNTPVYYNKPKNLYKCDNTPRARLMIFFLIVIVLLIIITMILFNMAYPKTIVTLKNNIHIENRTNHCIGSNFSNNKLISMNLTSNHEFITYFSRDSGNIYYKSTENNGKYLTQTNYEQKLKDDCIGIIWMNCNNNTLSYSLILSYNHTNMHFIIYGIVFIFVVIIIAVVYFIVFYYYWIE